MTNKKKAKETPIIEIQSVLNVQSRTGKPVQFSGDNPQLVAENELTIIYNGNLEISIISIEEYRLLHILKEHQSLLEKKPDWISIIGLVIALLVTLVSADFKDFLLRSDIWHILFVYGLVISVIWLLYSLVKYLEIRKKGTIEKLVEKIKSKKN